MTSPLSPRNSTESSNTSHSSGDSSITPGKGPEKATSFKLSLFSFFSRICSFFGSRKVKEGEITSRASNKAPDTPTAQKTSSVYSRIVNLLWKSKEPSTESLVSSDGHRGGVGEGQKLMKDASDEGFEVNDKDFAGFDAIHRGSSQLYHLVRGETDSTSIGQGSSVDSIPSSSEGGEPDAEPISNPPSGTVEDETGAGPIINSASGAVKNASSTEREEKISYDQGGFKIEIDSKVLKAMKYAYDVGDPILHIKLNRLTQKDGVPLVLESSEGKYYLLVKGLDNKTYCKPISESSADSIDSLQKGKMDKEISEAGGMSVRLDAMRVSRIGNKITIS